ATGGIGGVHPGLPPDISADLTELQRTPVLVVCAGAKAILDLPATREALETLGILVAGWGTDTLPGFYLRSSDLPVDVRVDSAGEIATIWRAHREMDAPGAILLCAPIPGDAEIPVATLSEAIEAALKKAGAAGIRGK